MEQLISDKLRPGDSERLEAFRNDLQAVCAKHGFAGLAYFTMHNDFNGKVFVGSSGFHNKVTAPETEVVFNHMAFILKEETARFGYGIRLSMATRMPQTDGEA